jgi:hypothetical protein
MVFSIMARVHASTTADEEFEPQSGQAKDYKIDICRFSSNHEALKSKNTKKVKFHVEFNKNYIYSQTYI